MTAPSIRWIFAAPEKRAEALRYWVRDPLAGCWIIGLHYLFRCLPIDWASGFGALMSRFQPARYPDSDARARKLWQTLRPAEADPASTDAAMRRLWRNVARTVAEYPVLDRLWAAGRIELEGIEHMDALRDSGQPIMCVIVHLGNWEVPPVVGPNIGYHGAALGLVLENRFENWLVQRTRRRFGGRMIEALPANVRAIVREIKERGPMCIYIDEAARGRVSAPAFGRPPRADGNIGYAIRLAKMTGAAIVPVYCLRQGDAARFKVTVMPPMPLDDTGDTEADLLRNVARLDAIIAGPIRDNLDQWFYGLDFEFGA